MFKNLLHHVRAALSTISVAGHLSIVQISSFHREIRFCRLTNLRCHHNECRHLSDAVNQLNKNYSNLFLNHPLLIFFTSKSLDSLKNFFQLSICPTNHTFIYLCYLFQRSKYTKPRKVNYELDTFYAPHKASDNSEEFTQCCRSCSSYIFL